MYVNIWLQLYIYVSMCVCVCVCVCNWVFKHNPFKFPDKRLGFRLKLVDEFTKIVPSAFEPFIGNHSLFMQATPDDGL